MSSNEIISKWIGLGNLYRIGMRRWLPPNTKTTVIGLEQWQNHWNSDTDSHEGTPRGYDLQSWRLLPTSMEVVADE